MSLPERISVFSRVPAAGNSKTRLIPALGDEGAARLQHSLSLRVLTHAGIAARRRDSQLELRLEGPRDQAARLFGSTALAVNQGPGELGTRMARCLDQGRRHGVQRHVIVGGDCPHADARILDEALSALASHELVLGPARDGGYYLIGAASAPPAELFRDMPWGGGEVFSKTLDRARASGLSVHVLPERPDIDRPDDLQHWQPISRDWPQLEDKPPISVIIPVLNEAGNLASLLPTLGGEPDVEVLVVDGGSRDDSLRVAESHGVRVLESPPGRAAQLNLGARQARCPLLLFLHADSRPPEGWAGMLRQAMRRSGQAGGAFRFAVDRTGLRYRLLTTLTNWRSHWLRLPYGDQGLFCRSETFHRLGGFPEMPIMEDYAFVRRLRRAGGFHLLKGSVVSSARNWERAGFWRVFLLHRGLLLAWHLGVDVERLAQWRCRMLGR